MTKRGHGWPRQAGHRPTHRFAHPQTRYQLGIPVIPFYRINGTLTGKDYPPAGQKFRDTITSERLRRQDRFARRMAHMTAWRVCPKCGQSLRIPRGKDHSHSGKCPQCSTAVDVPAASTAAASGSNLRNSAKAPPNPTARDGRTRSVAPPAASPAPATSHPKPQTLDDSSAAENQTPEIIPFRTPVRILADSHRQFAGSCFAVFVPHGLFLEQEPLKPLLYWPVGTPTEKLNRESIVVTLPDERVLVVRFDDCIAPGLAHDAQAFLRGERAAPTEAEYRRKWWLLWIAVIFALGLAVGPWVLTPTEDIGARFGLAVGGGLAFVGLLVNVAVVLWNRWPVPRQVLTMAGVAVVGTGLFLYGASVYWMGWNHARAVEATEVLASPALPAPEPSPPPVDEPPPQPPSHLDRAQKHGASALEDGPADVTALALAPDGNTLGVGFADGQSRLWLLDQPTFESWLLGPKGDGAITRMQFDASSSLVFAHTATGVFVAPRTGSSAVPVKIPGTAVAIAAALADDRIRLAAVRGNTLQHRVLPVSFVLHPPTKTRDLAIPGKTDEIIPINIPRDPPKPPGPTFLGWGGDRLYAGQPDGTITIYNLAMRPEAPARDHRAAVRAWAASPNGDFATGDEKGTVALWSVRGGKPTLWPVFDGVAVTGLSFNRTGSQLAITDSTGWLAIWDISAGRLRHRVKRPTPIRAVTFGPSDDLLLLAARRTVEVWSLPELVK